MFILVKRRAFLAAFLVFLTSAGFAAIKDADERDNHGVLEMHSMLRSRPFAGYFRSTNGKLEKVNETDAIFAWAAERFGGKDTGEPVLWNSDLPDAMAETLGDAVGRGKNGPAYIRISPVYRAGAMKGRYRDFESLWCTLVFELNNVASPGKVKELTDRIADGGITRDQFIDTCARLEYEAVWKTQDFYKKIWIPWAKQRSFKSDAGVWTEGYFDTYEEWVKQYDGYPEYPRGYYGKMFDEHRKYATDID